MNYEDHISAARTFLSAAEILSELGMGMAAAEMVWGAANQAIDAVNHRMMITRHASSNRDRRRVLQRIGRAHGVESELVRGFRAAANGLHSHFYTGNLSDDELEESMEAGIAFATRMLELAESPPR